MCNRAGHDKVCGQLHPTGDYSILQPGVQEQSISVEIIKPNVVRTYYWVQERCQVKSEIGQFLALAILKYPSLSFRLLYWCMQVSAYIFPFLMIRPTECVLTHGLIFFKKNFYFHIYPSFFSSHVCYPMTVHSGALHPQAYLWLIWSLLMSI